MKLTVAENNLHNKIKALVATERKTLAEIIENLQRVYDTRLFAKMGYSSLIKYLIKECGYSEAAAYRRYQALKLTKEIPEAKDKIENGQLNLSGITMLQTMMKGEDTESKKVALKLIQNKTTKEVQDTLFDMNPDLKNRKQNQDNKRRVTRDQTRISVTLSNSTMEKMNTLKARTKCYNTAKLIEKALDIMLSETDVTKTRTNKSKGSENPRVITAQVKKEVLIRSQRKCEHPGCDEIHNLEFDHRIPVAHGGTNAKENIRLVCKAHNQLYAIQKFGLGKMQIFIN